MITNKSSGYCLIDSGNGRKLERFGDRILIRPSTVAFWKIRNSTEWNKADGEYFPDRGWKFKSKVADEWLVDLGQVKLLLRCQQNGQIGLFPEHQAYMDRLFNAVTKSSGNNLLNLFAYTGMASVVAAQAGAQITHIDISKKCLTWAAKNFNNNGIDNSKVRLIPEDALQFLNREIKRGNKYDLIVADPPSFYRMDRSRIWKLDEHVHDLLGMCLKVLNKNSKLFFTCHSFSLEIFKNLILDFESQGLKIDFVDDLGLSELQGIRCMPAGVFAECSYQYGS